jgi:hypothetical protein
MKIFKIHSFLVNPEKGVEDQTDIRGTELPLKGSLFNLLSIIFQKAPNECKYDIVFNPSDAGAQQNDVKDLITEYTLNSKTKNGREIAKILQLQSTKRSGLGLLFLIVGKIESEYRLVISRFAAENGIIADDGGSSLKVKFIEQIFMKNAKAYKAAVYQGSNPASHFWTGKAIDKQINNRMNISEYWIKDFLKSDYTTTGERGSQQLAEALKSTINSSDTPIDIKEEITAAIKLAKGQNGQIVSMKTFLKRLGVSEEAVGIVKGQTKDSIFEARFKMIYEELCKYIAFKTVELDNGASLSAQTTHFEEVFDIEEDKGRLKYSTKGIIVNEKVRKRKQ